MPVVEDNIQLAGRRASLSGVVKEEGLLNAAPNTPFFLVHFRDAVGGWMPETEGLEGPTWLPLLSRVPIVAGTSGHRTRGEGEPLEASYLAAHDQIRQRGGIIIPLEFETAEIPGYMRVTDCRPRNADGYLGARGVYYHEAWCTPTSAGFGQRVKDRCDVGLYNRFRLSLVEAGIIPAPNPEILRQQIRSEERRLGNRQTRNYQTDAARDRALKEADDRISLARKARTPQATPTPQADTGTKAPRARKTTDAA